MHISSVSCVRVCVCMRACVRACVLVCACFVRASVFAYMCVFVFVHVIYCFKYSQVIVGESVCLHYSSIGDVCCG